MTNTQIIETLIAAHLFATMGKPLAAGEREAATEALKAVRFLPGPERVAIHEAIKAGAKLCAAA